MKYLVFVYLICASSMAVAQANNQKVVVGPVPKWVTESEPMTVPADAGGAVFVRRMDSAIHLDKDGLAQFTGYRMKILHSNALDLGNVTIAWNPAVGHAVVHRVRVHRGSEVYDVLKGATFEVLRREDQLEAAILNGNLTAVLRVPDLRVGDEIEFSATVRALDPTLGNKDAGMLVLAPDPAQGRFNFQLSWDEKAEPRIKASPEMAAAAIQGERSLTYKFDNPGKLVLPKDAPPRFQWRRIVEYSRFADWEEISRLFERLYTEASALEAGSPVKAEASRIAAAHSDPHDRMTAALKLVQQDVRYVYVGLNDGNFRPVSASETWKRRYGDCKGKTALLLAILRELGIEAEPVVVSNQGLDDGLDERLPGLTLFDHVLVRARLGGKSYWLDGTLPPVAAPSSIPVLPYQWVLPLTAKGSQPERLAWQPAAQPLEMSLFHIDAREGFDTPSTITSTTIKRGIEGLKQWVTFSALTPGQILEAFRQNSIGETWQSIVDVKWRYDQKAQASVLTIVGKGAVDWDKDDDGSRSLALPGGGFFPPEKRVRAPGPDQNAPYTNKTDYSCHVTTVRLPANTRPNQWSHKDNINTRIFGRTYYRVFELRDGSMRMIRGSRTEEKEQDAASALKDNARVAGFDNSMAWITYFPEASDEPQSYAKAVPATDEVDWLADNVPCLGTGPSN